MTRHKKQSFSTEEKKDNNLRVTVRENRHLHIQIDHSYVDVIVSVSISAVIARRDKSRMNVPHN